MSFLQRFFVQVNKRYRSLEEEISLEDFIQPHVFKIHLKEKPFSHVVIDNFFKEDFVEQLRGYYNEVYGKGLSEKPKDKSRFSRFEEKINYDGYLYSLPLTQTGPTGIFFSLQWNLFFSKLFDKPTSFDTNIALHYHPPRDRTGWVHSDYSIYEFPHTFVLPNGVSASRGESGEIKLSDVELLSANFRQKRTIAIIYYFNNEDWSEGDGGETGLYEHKEQENPVTKVAPINNRLLAFDITPHSYHAFQENLKDRNSIVQWFHVDLDWAEKKYGFL